MPKHRKSVPDWRSFAKTVLADALGERVPDELARALEIADNANAYHGWDDLRHRLQRGQWSIEQLWAFVRATRDRSMRRLPLLQDASARPFGFVSSDPMQAALHRIDTREAVWEKLIGKAGALGLHESSRVQAAIEEAHQSSVIEGAVTTRKQAQELLRTGRAPKNNSERMVLNNFRTLERLDEWTGSALDLSMLCAMHRSITEGTLEEESDSGRLRTSDDVHVVDVGSQEAVFQPPRAIELPQRMERLCEFANQDTDDLPFVHPVVRAILLHHQLAYDHPFVDGNGRTARTLFLWSILRSGYWWFRFMSISRSINRARGRYYRSFVDVQGDEGDATYFVRDQLRAIELETEILASALQRRALRADLLHERSRIELGLNHRQVDLLESILQDAGLEMSIQAHARLHGVSYPIAWKDLKSMQATGLLAATLRGRKLVFRGTRKLEKLRERLSEGGGSG
jgi:Fic family protein